MWSSLAANPNAPDLVLDATMRTLPLSSAVFLILSLAAGLLALGATVRNAFMFRVEAQRQDRAMQTLQVRERRLRLSAQGSEDGLVHLEPIRDREGRTVDFRVSDANVRAAALFRRDERDMLDVRTSSLASLAPETALFRDLVATLERGTVYRAEVRAHPRHVATSWLAVRAVAVDGGLAVTVTDIRESKREASRLRRASMTDELTGLVNRRAFLEQAETRLREAQAQGQDTLLLFLDCDRFKQINDTHGHQQGDRALQEIARALRGAVRETDVVARMGGDEFTILAVDAVGHCADTIRARINERIEGLNRQGLLPVRVSVSVGHAYDHASSSTSLEDLIELADLDLLSVKRAARSGHAATAQLSQSGRSLKARPAGTRGGPKTRLAAPVQLTGVVSAA